MNDELLKLAQAEYQRQFDIWLRSQPSQQSIINSYEKLEKLIEKYTKNLTDSEGKK